MIDYNAKIADLQRTIKIRADSRKSTAFHLGRLSQVRTLQIKQEMRDEKKRAKLAR